MVDRSSASAAGSSTVTVRPGWRRTELGNAPATGVRNRMHTPSRVLLANVRPRSASDTLGGPITRYHRYGPVTRAAATLARVVSTHHGPNRAVNIWSSTST